MPFFVSVDLYPFYCIKRVWIDQDVIDGPRYMCLKAFSVLFTFFFQISKPHEAVISKTVSVVDAAMVACDKIAYVQSGNLLTGIDNFSGSF